MRAWAWFFLCLLRRIPNHGCFSYPGAPLYQQLCAMPFSVHDTRKGL